MAKGKKRTTRTKSKPKIPPREYSWRPRATKFKCKYCTKKFSVRCSLNYHEYVHQMKRQQHKPKTSTTICGICSKEINNNNHICTITISSASSVSNNYDCIVCDRRFEAQHQLNDHMKIHQVEASDSEQSFECNVCSKTFRNLNHFETHKRIHRWIQSTEDHRQSLKETDLIFQSMTKESTPPIHERLNRRNGWRNWRKWIFEESFLKKHNQKTLILLNLEFKFMWLYFLKNLINELKFSLKHYFNEKWWLWFLRLVPFFK